MPAGAPYGNKNAEKWTFKKAVKLFNDAIELSNETDYIVVKIGDKGEKVMGYKYDFIGEIARELGTDHQLMIRHLPNRFPSLERLKNQLINNLESNCYANTKKGIIREATGIVNLKSNHKWTDRVDNTTKGNEIKQTQIIAQTQEQANEIKELLKKFE